MRSYSTTVVERLQPTESKSMPSTKHFPDVKNTPENERYIRSSKLSTYLQKPIFHRLAWLGACLLSVASCIPLGLKCLVNFFHGFSEPSSFKEAAKNFLGLIGFPLIGGIISALSIIMPSKIGGTVVKTCLLPIRYLFKNSKTLADKSIKNEIGPRSEVVKQTSAVIEFPESCGIFLKNKSMILPPNRSYPTVKGLNDIIIDTADLPAPNVTSRYRLLFNAAAEIYQFNLGIADYENSKYKINTRLFNYPDITKKNELDSRNDFVNAGIAQVYDLAKRMNWTNEDIEKNLHLSGYCLGGGVALQVAAYFKEKHNIDLLVFVDRSFASLKATTAALVSKATGLPLWLSKAYAGLVLYAGGEYNLDSINAARKLNPDKIHYFNLGHLKAPPKPNSFLQKVKNFLGIGAPKPDADAIIADEATLASNLTHHSCNSTSSIFVQLGSTEGHEVYCANPHTDGHFAALEELYLDKQGGKSLQDYYNQLLTNQDSEQEVKESHGFAPNNMGNLRII